MTFIDDTREGASGGQPDDRGAVAGGPAALPCLNSNNSIESILTGGQKRTAFALAENVRMMAEQHGIERLLFNTLTFRDHVLDIREAQRRFNSLRTNILAERYCDFVTVVERMKSGRIHFHLVVATRDDMRTGFDFEAAARGDYRSACPALRSEWAFWRHTAPKYGFGRTEQLPVKSTSEGIAKYVGKYIAKHVGQRKEEDKGARMVRYSDGARRCRTRFAWTGEKSKRWRRQLEQFALRHGCPTMDALRDTFGPKWAYLLAEYIAEEVVV